MAAYNAYNDEQLLDLLKSSDEKAFRELYDRYWQRLFYKVAKKINDVFAAEEVVQDIFLSLWNRRTELRINVKLSTYLSAAATYGVIKCRQKRERERALQQEAGRLYKTSENTTEDMLAFELLQDRIASLVTALPEQTRIIYTLHKEEGHSYKDIADTLHISPKTVDYHISKAIKNLRSALSLLLFFFPLH